MLVHTAAHSCYKKTSTPIKKGFTAKEKYDKALAEEKQYYDRQPAVFRKRTSQLKKQGVIRWRQNVAQTYHDT